MPSIDGRRAAIAGVPWDRTTHPALWLDKYLPVLKPSTDEEKQQLRRLIDQASATEVPDAYREVVARRERALRSISGGTVGGVTRIFVAKALGRLIVGLGAESIRETNLAMLHAWGVPFIPGSALKGLAASTAQLRGGPDWRKAEAETGGGEQSRIVFGDTTSAGYVGFHDAWWIPKTNRVPLDLDTMTLHHPDYYGGKAAPPSDMDEPNPVAFVTAAGEFQLALSGPRECVEAAAEWLKLGLGEYGVGAKTFAGYGRMTLDLVPGDEELKERAQRQRWEELRRNLLALVAQHRGAPTASQHIARLHRELALGAPVEIVAEVAKALFAREPSFWRKWASERHRTVSEREVIERCEMIPAAVSERPAVAPPPVALVAKTEWIDGEAWISEDAKGRRQVFFRASSGKFEPRNEKDVTIEGTELARHMEAASASSPLRVTAEVKKSKVLRLKAR